MHEVPENHILLDQVAVGVAADRGLPPSFTMKQIKDELVAIARECGRWCDFIDSFDSLKKHWHGKLFFLMWALLLEGVNPLHTLSDAFGIARTRRRQGFVAQGPQGLLVARWTDPVIRLCLCKVI